MEKETLRKNAEAYLESKSPTWEKVNSENVTKSAIVGLMAEFSESLLDEKDKKYATLEQFAKKLNENWKRGEQEREEMINDFLKSQNNCNCESCTEYNKQAVKKFLETKPNK